MRNHTGLRYMINPLNAYWSAGVVAVQANSAPDGPAEAVATDARFVGGSGKPRLLLWVVGETARAANFSLNGYARPTNPKLAAHEDLLSFEQVSACGTSTAASLPCMFSHLGREAFQQLEGEQENLLDALHRAGLAVLWLDNQSGCKGVCDRIPHAHAREAVSAQSLDPALCEGGECMDMALLAGLDERLQQLDPARVARGVVLVLHQMGSHGPAYHKRSPPELKPFQPECQTSALQQCPRSELLNAYDNSIAYTDHLLDAAIRWLGQQQTRFDTALLYVSDHGESLGENNIYLHGMPYAVAPREQIHVPLLMWLPEPSATAWGVDRSCLKQQLQQPTSHDQLFHTVLRLSQVQTQLYRPDWDLLEPCRKRTDTSASSTRRTPDA